MYSQPDTVGDKFVRLVVVVIMIVVLLLILDWTSQPPEAGAFLGSQWVQWL